jgi:hypothetical protein
MNGSRSAKLAAALAKVNVPCSLTSRAARRKAPSAARDGVVEVGATEQKILRPCGEGEREGRGARGFDRRGHALDRMREIVDRPGGIAARILDRGTDQARPRGEPDRLRRGLGRIAEAVLEIGGDR